MPDLIFTPSLDSLPALPMSQRIDLREAGAVVATAHWHAPASSEGAIQILDLTVVPEHRRKGHGSTLILALRAQAIQLGKLTGVPTRRIWISVEQQTQVKARAFLTRHGYHHVATIKELLREQDALVYLLAMD
jgi:ribosomal protein S18 acetylase RimI-like enzyme